MADTRASEPGDQVYPLIFQFQDLVSALRCACVRRGVLEGRRRVALRLARNRLGDLGSRPRLAVHVDAPLEPGAVDQDDSRGEDVTGHASRRGDLHPFV